jgi:hypothetical protein
MGYKSLEDKRQQAIERNKAHDKRSITEQLELIKHRPGKSEKEVRKLHQQLKQNENGKQKERQRTPKTQSN